MRGIAIDSGARRGKVAQIQFSTSLAFTATARRVFVGKSQPEKLDLKRTAELGGFGGLGLVRAETGIAVGERVFERGMTRGRPPTGEPRVVADIDREARASLGEWLITWAGEPQPCSGNSAPAVTLDPERFAHVLLAWAYDQTEGGKTTASLAGFAPGDIPLNCAAPLARHLQAAGLLQVSDNPRPAVVSLTAQGITAAQLAASERGDRLRRAEELRNGIIRWLWEADDIDGRADLHDFPRDRHCTFRGHFFDLSAVYHEYTYLVEKGLVHDGRPWWFAPRLTAAGRDCAAYKGGNVQKHLNPQPTNGPTVNFNGNNSGNVAIGHDMTLTTSTVTTPTDTTSSPAPSPAESAPPTATPTDGGKTGKNGGFWSKGRAIATGTAGVITLVCTIVIAVFTVLTWLIMSR
jgi:hypothetical protein